MGKESSLVWTPIAGEIKKRGWHAQRFEDKAAVGIPDVNIHIPNFGDVWLELKYVDTPAPSSKVIDIGLRREQYIWLKEGKEAGRDCRLVARIGDMWYFWRDTKSWELCKRSNPLAEVMRRAIPVNGPQNLLDTITLYLRPTS